MSDNMILVLDFGGSQSQSIARKVRMESADCPDHLCVKKGEKSLTWQTIVCLPNEVVVEIIGASAGDVDFTQGGGVLP